MNNLSAILDFILRLLEKAAPPIIAYFAGKSSVKDKIVKENLEDVQNAKDIDVRIDTDSSYRKRVQDTFRG